MIRSKKKKKRKRRAAVEEEEEVTPVKRSKQRSGTGGTYLGEDGYLHHSDSEADWSDVAEDLYTGAKKKDKISRKEANRRRQWAGNDDAATASGRPWPVFPRHVVKEVLSTVLDEVMKYDEESGGSIFSVPVPKDDFPEYYEQIKNPMDYGTMKKKLENGEYRSAQAMQKDFILILQNCRQFNAPSSDIVKEAREQHLLRPKILKQAAAKHNLFLAEDGTVLEIVDEPKKGTPGKKRRRRRKKGEAADDEEADAESADEGEYAGQKVRFICCLSLPLPFENELPNLNTLYRTCIHRRKPGRSLAGKKVQAKKPARPTRKS